MKVECVMKNVFICILALAIPALLVLNTLQARKFARLEEEVLAIEKRQYEVIEENKRLIASISKLSSPDRIEMIATDTLNMEKAKPEDIIRVEVKGKNNGN